MLEEGVKAPGKGRPGLVGLFLFAALGGDKN